jgi:hypothetical protein
VSKRLRNFLRAKVVGLDDLSRRIFRYLGYLRQERVYGPDVAVLRGDSGGYGRKLRPASAYAALIAAISGPIPRMSSAI